MELGLNGHSGASVNLGNYGGRYFVEKVTDDPKYKDRLKAQFEIQKKFKAYGFFNVPEIYETDEENHLFSYRMEYVPSKNFIQFFEHANKEEIDRFVESLIYFLKTELQQAKIQEVSTDVFKKKWESCKANMNALAPEFWKDSIKIVDEKFAELGDVMYLPIGQNHGDLTFSNILFKETGDHYLIDMLDSFIETPVMDLVKIRQDSKYLWSLNMAKGKYDEGHMKIVAEYIDEKICEEFEDTVLWNYYDAFQLMNIVRIAQYAKDINVMHFLADIIEEFK